MPYGRSQKILAVIFLIAGLLAAYLLMWPTPVDPKPFNPPEPPEMTGPWEVNVWLMAADHIGAGKFDGPEDIAMDQHGRVYGGSHDGIIHRTNLHDPENVETFAETGGRPLGMMFDADGNLIVADAWKGLLSVNPQGEFTVLTTESEGVPFRFTNDLDINFDGTIYFSDASSRFTQPEYLYDLLEARPHGRLLKYDPKTGETETLLDGLYFANGVALSKNRDFVLVNETYRYRITRYWLDGPKKGSSEIFMDNLPGFPDNLSSTGDGRFWVALFTVRNDLMDRLHPSPLLKKVLSRLPAFMWPKPQPYGFVAELDEDGNVLRTFQDPTGSHLTTITSVMEINNKLYMGSLYNDRIGVLDLQLFRSRE